jgi:hypothetical protein
MNITEPARSSGSSSPGPEVQPGRLAVATGIPLQPAPRLAIGLIAAAAFALEMAVSGRYGYVRDELYFLASGQHLTYGGVDQPLLTPLLARLSALLTGNSLVGLRVIPALAFAALVVLTAAMSRRAGAGRIGQVLAALAAATCAEFLGAGHELTTTPPDFFFWALTLLLVMRLVTSQDPRWWLAIGACVGVGLDAKWNIGFLAISLGIGFLATDARRLLRSRYLLAGCALAAVLGCPDLVWQALHGWPNLDVFRTLQGDAGHNRAVYWPGQLVYTGLALTPVWVTGLAWTLRKGAGSALRPIGIACAVAIALQFALGGKVYYAGGAYAFLLAAGVVPLERWLAGRRPFAGKISPVAAVTAAMLASVAIMLPVALPVLPASVLSTIPLQKINYDLAESIAWPRQVALVAREYRALPAALRRHATILAGNYGEAGAIDRYGPGMALPQVYSGANNFWLWGPPPAGDTSAIVLNMNPRFLRREFEHVRLLATFWNGIGVSDDEQGTQLYLATGLKTTWARAWAAFRDYS